MKSIAARIALLLASLFTGFAGAQDMEIKGLQLGANLKDEAAKFGFTCLGNSLLPICMRLSLPSPDKLATIAGVQTINVVVEGHQDKLGRVSFTFRESGFNAVRDAFRDKHPDLSCTETMVQNRMGASFDQSVCTVKSGTASLLIKRRGYDLTHGYIEMQSDAFSAAKALENERQKQNQKKDI